ncbi:MAG TPA: LysM peptidoglycan-binding domain-containing protein [Dehalococcoidia bacterium]|nr:LysM peptidoglycan-binding domain-containing protein [Dehalococcoidia bacterium]
MPFEPLARRYTRRQLIGAAAAAGIGGAAALRATSRPASAAPDGNFHLAWVWQFSTDGEPNAIGQKLRDYGLGILLKTHDGVTWMAEYDTSKYAVTGQPQVQVLANYFEGAGVPFHAWCVLHGTDPIEEARMAAAVLLSGARSLFLDVEPHQGFWRGTAQDAVKFGQELRRLAPDKEVHLSVDARPWLRDAIPLKEFGGFINSIAPQQYWRTFDTPANYEKYAAAGHPVPSEGLTPEFLLSVTHAVYGNLGMPIHHTGQGSTADPNEWRRFIDAAYALGNEYVSIWRYGVSPADVLNVLREKPARQPAPPPQVAAPVAGPADGTHVVQSGETLGLIAGMYGTTVNAIVQANGLSDPNYIYVGQQLVIPGAGASTAAAPAAPSGGSSAGTSAPAPAASSGGTTYVVESGDTLYGIAGRFGTSVGAIAAANGLDNPNYIYTGQQLSIP